MLVSKACGFVLYRTAGHAREYLLLTSRAHGEAGLAKGHVEPGETELETALRETEEETGLVPPEPDPFFRREIRYHAMRRGRAYDKTVVYFLAEVDGAEVRLSAEHTKHRWAGLGETFAAVRFENLRWVLKEAALFLKDPALFDLAPLTEAQADAHLAALPEASPGLLAHLRGGARLARAFAEGLSRAGIPVAPGAAAAGTLLHDVGRALGRHDDHQLAGLAHLRETALAPYGFACISHFTKGATFAELLAAGLSETVVRAFHEQIDCRRLTWEERAAALADACMMGGEAVPPRERFADLRRRYDAEALIALQEERTRRIRRDLSDALGEDPLALVDLA